MTSRVRKLLLTAHITFSVGGLGAVVAYLSPAITALTSDDPQVVRSAFIAMEQIGWFELSQEPGRPIGPGAEIARQRKRFMRPRT